MPTPVGAELFVLFSFIVTFLMLIGSNDAGSAVCVDPNTNRKIPDT